jgi:hypothetical protein
MKMGRVRTLQCHGALDTARVQRIQVHVVKPLDIHLALGARRQVDKGGLAGAVAGAVGDGDGAGARGDVEHAPAALLAEVW